jgi:hypothetical protein
VAGVKRLKDRPKCKRATKWDGLIFMQHMSKSGGTSLCSAARKELLTDETILNCYGPFQFTAAETKEFMDVGCTPAPCSIDPHVEKAYHQKDYNLTRRRFMKSSKQARFHNTVMMVRKPRSTKAAERSLEGFVKAAADQGIKFYQNEWKPFLPGESTALSTSLAI